MVPLCMFSFVFGQTYSFRYRIGADSTYTSAVNVVQSNSMGQYALGLLRKQMYSNFYYEGFSSADKIYYKWNLHGVDMKDTMRYNINDSANYDPVYGHKKSSIIKFDYNKEIALSFDLKKKIQYFITDDTVKGAYYITDEPCNRIDEYKTINGWHCVKWVPEGNMVSNITIWVSKEVPVNINFGIFNKEFEGGIVRVEWANGRYNELLSFEKQAEPYNFKQWHTDIKPGGNINLLRSSALDDLTDSMYGTEKHNGFKPIDQR